MGNVRIKKWMLLPCMFAFLLVAQGCSKRDLDPVPTTGGVKLTFDWSKLVTGESIPSKMRLYFFGSDGSVVTGESDGKEYTGQLPFGTYQVVACNEDGSNVSISGDTKYSDISAYSPTATKAASYMSQPSYFYGVGLPTITITATSISTSTITPVPLVEKGTILFNITGNVKNVSSISCSLSGLAQSVKIANGELVGTSGLISFSPTAVANTSEYQSAITFWGRAASSTNTLSFQLNFTDGTSQTLSKDISSALTNLSATVAVNVDVDIDITGNATLGFKGTIKDWTSNTVNIEVN